MVQRKADFPGYTPRASFLPFSSPSIGEEEIREVVETLRSGWITTGPKTERFEEAFKEAVGCRNAIALSSATAGLHIALKALGIRDGDEVITSPMTFASTVNQIVLAGANPVFTDIEFHHLMMDVSQVEEKITPRTRLVIPVHFAGAPVDMDPLLEIAGKHNLAVLEDAAHGAGTLYRGRPVGNLGLGGIYSFHPIKNMTTGEGGMFVTDDDELAETIRLLKFHGLSREAWKRYGRTGRANYDVLMPGFKYNMTDIQAALGIHQLAKLPDFCRKRAWLAEQYDQAFAGVEEVVRPGRPSYPHFHAWHLYVIKLQLEALSIDRDTFMEELKKRNIGTGLHFKAVHLHPYYQEKMGFRRGTLPSAEKASDRILSLPLFPGMEEEDLEDCVAALKDVIRRSRK